MIPCFNISYSFRVEMISFLTGSFLSGCVFLHFHIHLNSKEKNMCCGEIEIAQGYVLERASSKFHQLDTNFTVTVIYINFCCKNCVNNRISIGG